MIFYWFRCCPEKRQLDECLYELIEVIEEEHSEIYVYEHSLPCGHFNSPHFHVIFSDYNGSTFKIFKREFTNYKCRKVRNFEVAKDRLLHNCKFVYSTTSFLDDPFDEQEYEVDQYYKQNKVWQSKEEEEGEIHRKRKHNVDDEQFILEQKQKVEEDRQKAQEEEDEREWEELQEQQRQKEDEEERQKAEEEEREWEEVQERQRQEEYDWAEKQQEIQSLQEEEEEFYRAREESHWE